MTSTTRAGGRGPVAWWRAAAARQRRLRRIDVAGPAGWLWAALLAWDFFLMSNPLVLVDTFQDALRMALLSTGAVIVVTIPLLRLPRVPVSLLLLVCYMCTSAMWSIDADLTWRAVGLYGQVGAIALVAGANLTPRTVAVGVSLGGVAVLATSWYGFVNELPGAFYFSTDGMVLIGVGMNQNILGYTLTLALAAALSLGVPRGWGWRAAWAVPVGVLGWGVQTAGSASGYVTAAVLVLATVAMAVTRHVSLSRRAAWSWTFGAGVVLTATLYVVDSVLGKEASTLSARTPFWEATFETVDDRLLFGYGWGTVWAHPWNTAPLNEIVQRIYDAAGTQLTHGHNAFVDPVPEIGLAGVALFVLVLGHAAVRALGRQPRRPVPPDQVGDLPADPPRDVRRQSTPVVLLVLLALLSFGVTEPMLTVPLGWWALVLVLALVDTPAPQPAADADGGSAARRRSRQAGRHRTTSRRPRRRDGGSTGTGTGTGGGTPDTDSDSDSDSDSDGTPAGPHPAVPQAPGVSSAPDVVGTPLAAARPEQRHVEVHPDRGPA